MAVFQAHAIMFHHMYCYLVMLAKSNHLNKNVLDMNQHYLELQAFLDEVHDPETEIPKFLYQRKDCMGMKKTNYQGESIGNEPASGSD